MNYNLSSNSSEISLPLGAGESSVWSGSSHNASSATSGAPPSPKLEPVAPYIQYLPPHLRGELAKAEFDLLMLQKEVERAKLDKERQTFLAPKRKTYTLPYYMHDKQLKLAVERFPRTTFKVGVDNDHDHPLAHLETMIGADRMVRMIPAGRFVWDIYGSPKRCMELNGYQRRSNNPKTFMAFVQTKTEKDLIRQSHWAGDDFVHLDDFTLEELFCAGGQLAPDDNTTFMLVQTLYYLSDEQIVTLLKTRGTSLMALIHRHPHKTGAMFGGEATYAKVNGMVEQVNTATGERYHHRDLSFLFTSTTKVQYASNGAYTWTLHKVTDETWIIEMVGCPDSLNERFVKREKDIGRPAAIDELNDHALVATPFPHPALARLPGTTCKMVGGIPVVTLDRYDLTVQITCPDLVEYLMLHMSGKPRDALRLQDCFNLARMHVADGSDFAGKIGFRVSGADLAGHVMMGFVSGLVSEVKVAGALAVYRSFIKQHQSFLDFTYVVDDGRDRVVSKTEAGLMALKRIQEGRKEGDLVGGVLKALNI